MFLQYLQEDFSTRSLSSALVRILGLLGSKVQTVRSYWRRVGRNFVRTTTSVLLMHYSSDMREVWDLRLRFLSQVVWRRRFKYKYPPQLPRHLPKQPKKKENAGQGNMSSGTSWHRPQSLYGKCFAVSVSPLFFFFFSFWLGSNFCAYGTVTQLWITRLIRRIRSSWLRLEKPWKETNW